MVSSHRRKRQKLSSSYSVCLGGATDSVSDKESQYIESTQQPRVRVSLESPSFYQADFLQVKKPIVLPIIDNWLAYNIENFETLQCLTRLIKQMWPCSVHLAYREPPSGKRYAGHIFQIGHVHVPFISKMIYNFNLSFSTGSVAQWIARRTSNWFHDDIRRLWVRVPPELFHFYFLLSLSSKPV